MLVVGYASCHSEMVSGCLTSRVDLRVANFWRKFLRGRGKRYPNGDEMMNFIIVASPPTIFRRQNHSDSPDGRVACQAVPETHQRCFEDDEKCGFRAVLLPESVENSP